MSQDIVQLSQEILNNVKVIKSTYHFKQKCFYLRIILVVDSTVLMIENIVRYRIKFRKRSNTVLQ